MSWETLSVMAASALLVVACGKADQPTPATVSATSAPSANSAPSASPGPSATATAAPVTYVTLPDTYGQNAETATTTLEDLGLTNVELASSNTKHSAVVLPKDWKVVGMRPGAGTVVKTDDPVVLTVVKVR